MEIFIVGIIVVALMVFVSTKIKKSAAHAFEREIIETENYKIVKPEGFINPLRENSDYEFEAYSKDFGEKDERNIWQAQVYLSVSANSNFAAVCERAKQQSDEVLSEEISADAIGGEKICLIETEKTEEETKFYEFRKIVESRRQHKIYDLRIMVLKSFRDVYAGKIEELANGFSLK